MEIETSKLHLSFREPKEYSKPLLPITKEEKNTAKQSDSYFDEKKKQENDIRDSLSLI